MDIEIKALIIPLIIAITVFLLGRWSKRQDKASAARLDEMLAERRKADKLKEEVIELQKQMAVLSAQAVPINAAYLAMSIAKLTHYHEPITDKLLEKALPDAGPMTREEIIDLEAAMKKRELDMGPEIDEEERIRAKILPDLIVLAQIEKDKDLKNPVVETVLVSQPAAEETLVEHGEEPDAVGN